MPAQGVIGVGGSEPRHLFTESEPQCRRRLHAARDAQYREGSAGSLELSSCRLNPRFNGQHVEHHGAIRCPSSLCEAMAVYAAVARGDSTEVERLINAGADEGAPARMAIRRCMRPSCRAAELRRSSTFWSSPAPMLRWAVSRAPLSFPAASCLHVGPRLLYARCYRRVAPSTQLSSS